MCPKIFILLVIGIVGPLAGLTSASRSIIPRRGPWITLPLPIPSPSGSGSGNGAGTAPECDNIVGCPTGSGGCNTMTPPTCTTPVANRVKCYWPVPNTPTGCMKLANVMDCECENPAG